MATTNPFTTIRNLPSSNDKSLAWYQQQIKTLSAASIRPGRLMQNTASLTGQILPGFMYMFFYEAKYQDTLPYWDKFPLVLPFRKIPDGFYGINLHYLPYLNRFRLLERLHDLAADDKVDEKTRIQISWKALNALSSVAPIKACVKHYLNEQVQSRFLNIPYPDWITASLLPVERFVGATKQQVWQKSKDQM